MAGLEFLGLELRSMFAIDCPGPTGFEMLARRDHREAAEDRHEVAPARHLDLKHDKPVFRVVEGDPLNQAGEQFGHGGNLFSRDEVAYNRRQTYARVS